MQPAEDETFWKAPNLPDHESGVGFKGVEEAAQRVGRRAAVTVALQEQEGQDALRDAFYQRPSLRRRRCRIYFLLRCCSAACTRMDSS